MVMMKRAWSKVREATIVVAASDSLSPKEADITCDGIADNVEIQAANDALLAGGGSVELSDGTFTLAAPIKLSSNVTLRGQGKNTVILPPAGAYAGNIIENLDPAGGDEGIEISHLLTGGCVGVGVYFVKVTNSSIHDCWFGNFQYCVHLHTNCSSNRVENNHFETPGGCTTHIREEGDGYTTIVGNVCVGPANEAVSVYGDHNTITGNIFTAILDGVCLVGDYNTLQGNTFINNTVNDICVYGGAYCSIVGNTCQHDAPPAQYCVYVTTGLYTTITGNVLTGGVMGIRVNEATPPPNPNYVTIQGNVITDNTQDGIRLDGVVHCDGIISNNIIANNGRDGIFSWGGRLVISGNLIESNGYNGICVYDQDRGTKIIGNEIHTNSTAAPGTYDGIRVGNTTGLPRLTIIIGNRIYGADHDYGIKIDGPSDWCIVARNDLRNNGTGAISYIAPEYAIYEKHSDLFMDVLAAQANLIVNAQNFVNGAIALTGVQPKYPRGLVFAITAGVTDYTLTVVGTNGKGETITEVYTFAADGLAWSSDTAFDHVTSITLADRAGAAATIDVGIDERLGLMDVIYETGDIWKITKNTVKQVVAGAQVDVDYNIYDMSVIGLALNDDFEIWYKSNLNIIS